MDNQIVYCHFGQKDLGKDQLINIKQWQKLGYETLQINENNFDVNSYLFAKTAYEQKKYAFVSDVARIHYLYNNGGIYLDTDVELVKRLDPFCKLGKLVISFEYYEWELTGVNMGTIISNAWNKKLKLLLDYYKNNRFDVNKSSQMTINKLFLKLAFNNQLALNNKKQIGDDYVVLKYQIFCKKSKESYTIHHFASSWQKEKSIYQKLRRFTGKMVKKIIGNKGFKSVWKKN